MQHSLRTGRFQPHWTKLPLFLQAFVESRSRLRLLNLCTLTTNSTNSAASDSINTSKEQQQQQHSTAYHSKRPAAHYEPSEHPYLQVLQTLEFRQLNHNRAPAHELDNTNWTTRTEQRRLDNSDWAPRTGQLGLDKSD